MGPEQVFGSPQDQLLYSYDAGSAKSIPGVVVLPRTPEEVSAAVQLAYEAGIPYAARGAGTNLCGGTIVPPGGMIVHLSRLNKLLSLDLERRRVRVEPGLVNLGLQQALARQGHFYAPDPASLKACTLGGNVGTNAGGPHCLKYGVTAHHVMGLDVVLPDGRFWHMSVDENGFDTTGFWVGSEGTLGIVVGLELSILPLPPRVETLLAGFQSLEKAAEVVSTLIAQGIVPASLEMVDRLTIDAVEDFLHVGYPRGMEAVLLIELDGEVEVTQREAERVEVLARELGADFVRRARSEQEREKLWEGRRGAYPSLARLAPNVLVEDGVVPRTRLPEAVKKIRAIAQREGLRMGLIAHAGDGNLHPNIVFDERDETESRRVHEAGKEMLRACVDLGGSISGEHGIGLSKREAMRWLFTPETLGAFRRVKEALDPANLCNPDKILPVVSQTPVIPPLGKAPSRRRLSTLEELMGFLLLGKGGVTITGLGTRGAPRGSAEFEFNTAGLKTPLDIDPHNMTLTLGAGWPLEEVRQRAREAGRWLWISGGGTVGGALSSRGGGKFLRDEVLGLKALLAQGDKVQFGARVMKNVAGYEATKLFLGAWGSLGLITEVTFRLHPLAPPEDTSPPTAKDFSWTLHPILHTLKKAWDPANRFNPHFFAESFHERG